MARNKIFLSNIGPPRTDREKLYDELLEARDPEWGPLRGTNLGKRLINRDMTRCYICWEDSIGPICNCHCQAPGASAVPCNVICR